MAAGIANGPSRHSVQTCQREAGNTRCTRRGSLASLQRDFAFVRFPQSVRERRIVGTALAIAVLVMHQVPGGDPQFAGSTCRKRRVECYECQNCNRGDAHRHSPAGFRDQPSSKHEHPSGTSRYRFHPADFSLQLHLATSPPCKFAGVQNSRLDRRAAPTMKVAPDTASVPFNMRQATHPDFEIRGR